jgi:hypothetical protein
LRQHLGNAFRQLAAQKGRDIVQGHLTPGHVYMMIAIPPKLAVSQVVGYIRGQMLCNQLWYMGNADTILSANTFGQGIIREHGRSRYATTFAIMRKRKLALTNWVSGVEPAAFRW